MLIFGFNFKGGGGGIFGYILKFICLGYVCFIGVCRLFGICTGIVSFGKVVFFFFGVRIGGF